VGLAIHGGAVTPEGVPPVMRWWDPSLDQPEEDTMDKPMNRRQVAKGGGALTGFAAARALLQKTAHAEGPSTPEGTPEQSLYDRLGGIFAISAVVNRFSDAIITNPKLNVNPALKAWNATEAVDRLPGLKVMRTIWIAALTGGPFVYTGVPLHDAHTRFHLTSDDFDEVGAEIVRALDYYGVPDQEKQQLVDAYMLSKPDVVTSSA
jgi:hemoglobin